MGKLDGKVALITGAGSGIGEAAARRFVAEGARVVCADISGGQQAVAESLGPAAIAVHADVSQSADVQAMVQAALDTFGRLDIACNNAGFGGKRAPLHEIDEDYYHHVLAVNLHAVFLGMKYQIPAMLAGGGGSIVNTASAAGLVGWQHLGAYSAAKGGVIQMTKAAALDYATQGIRINCICPGMTWTGLAHKGAGGDPVGAPPQPMKRWGLPDELAAAILFLASDEASFVTGAALSVDGGYVAR